MILDLLIESLYFKQKQYEGVKMRKLFISTLAVLSILILAGCQDDVEIASYNLSKSADNFEVDRRIIFYNGITNDYMLEITGRCSLNDELNQLEVTCKTGDKAFVKHFLGLSDNVTYFAEQLKTSDVSVYHHRITFKPQTIIPDIDFRGSTEELFDNKSEVNQ